MGWFAPQPNLCTLKKGWFSVRVFHPFDNPSIPYLQSFIFFSTSDNSEIFFSLGLKKLFAPYYLIHMDSYWVTHVVIKVLNRLQHRSDLFSLNELPPLMVTPLYPPAHEDTVFISFSNSALVKKLTASTVTSLAVCSWLQCKAYLTLTANQNQVCTLHSLTTCDSQTPKNVSHIFFF